MAEQRRFEVGQKVRVIRSASERQEWSGRIGTVKHHRTGNSYGVEDGDLYCVAYEEDMKPADTSPTADPVVGVDDVRFLKELHRQADPLPFVTEILGEWRDPVVEQPKADLPRRCKCGQEQRTTMWKGDRCGDCMLADRPELMRTTEEREARGRLVAALAAEHTRQSDSSGLLHPRSWWSGRNSGRRAR